MRLFYPKKIAKRMNTDKYLQSLREMGEDVGEGETTQIAKPNQTFFLCETP